MQNGLFFPLCFVILMRENMEKRGDKP
jgi:hypothetical protein